MHSKKLRQTIDLILDTRGMEGPVTRRQIAEEVMRVAEPSIWSAADEHDARLAYVQHGVTERMAVEHSPEFIEKHLAHIPEQYREMFRKLPRFICISARGGRGSEHQMTLNATREHWEANFALKDQIVQATRISRDESKDIRDLLIATGATCLADLLRENAA